MRIYPRRRLQMFVLAAFSLVLSPFLFAQDSQSGIHYYAVENLRTGQVDQRGTTQLTGVAFRNLILAPNTPYRIWLLQASSLRVAKLRITTPGAGNQLRLPAFQLRAPNPEDSDKDGVHNTGEFILGTNPRDEDSDGDGVKDGAEILAGTDPLDGSPARTGIIASTDSPGNAIDIEVANDLAILADGNAGVSIFNVFNRMNPQIIAQIPTSDARRVAFWGSRVAVADGAGGLRIIETADPPNSSIVHSLPEAFLRGSADCVAATANLVYVGVSNGDLVLADLSSGTFIDRLRLNGAVLDLALSGDHLFAITDQSTLYALPVDPVRLSVLSSVTSTSAEYRRLSVSSTEAYITQLRGYDVIDIRNPGQMSVTTAGLTTQFGWSHLVPTASGQGFVALGPNPGGTASQPTLIDLTNPDQTTNLLTTFPSPGEANAVSVFNGLGYVADGSRGLQVVNYLASDTQNQAPTVSLQSSFGFTELEEGKLGRLTAVVSDDVQIRNVEFYIDGQRVFTDGNFPYEYRFIAPPRSQQATMRLQIRASDTGGNAAVSAEVMINIIQDPVAPTVRNTFPLNGALLSSVNTLSVSFDEPMNPGSLSTAASLVEAGPDAQFGTADDISITLGAVEFRETVLAAFYSLPSSLAPGFYQATLSTAATDLVGNPLAQSKVWNFRVFGVGGSQDSDGDGLSDSLEALLGLDPNDSDSDNDGIFDGDEDNDGDGLSNINEIALSTDPNNPDSDNNGINDGAEDPDFDRLPNSQELSLQTNPFASDTDGDGFDDKSEVDEGSDPRNPQSLPLRAVFQQVSVYNQAAPTIEKNSEFVVVTVKNNAAPEAVSGSTTSLVVSVKNNGNP